MARAEAVELATRLIVDNPELAAMVRAEALTRHPGGFWDVVTVVYVELLREVIEGLSTEKIMTGEG